MSSKTTGQSAILRARPSVFLLTCFCLAVCAPRAVIAKDPTSLTSSVQEIQFEKIDSRAVLSLNGRDARMQLLVSASDGTQDNSGRNA